MQMIIAQNLPSRLKATVVGSDAQCSILIDCCFVDNNIIIFSFNVQSDTPQNVYK